MICDAHVHVGYFDRKGYDGPYYYSPRRICLVLRRCGVGEFIFSSTSMQTRGIVFDDVHRESREVVRIWGRMAHPFLWVTGDYLKHDPSLRCLDEGLYEGLKLHGCETAWLTHRRHALGHVLEIASGRGLPVIAHTGAGAEADPIRWLDWAVRFDSVRFDFAHCAPADVALRCVTAAPNVYVDVSCVDEGTIRSMTSSAFAGRVLWGSDLPALASRSGMSLTRDLRRRNRLFGALDDRFGCQRAFAGFLKGAS